MESLAMIIGIVMMVLNLVGIIWLGIVIEHWFLTLIGYIIALVIVGSFSETGFIILMGITSVATIVVIIVYIVMMIKDKKLQKQQNELNIALLNAVKEGNKQTVQELMEKGGNANYIGYVSSDKKSLLEIAVENNDKEMVALLIEEGADVNYKYPLDLAKNEEIIEILKSNGAKTKAEVEEEKRAEEERKRLKAEESRKKYELQTMLNEDLLTAIQRGNFDMVKSLISQGADVNYATMDGNSPLTFAVYSGDMEIIKFLLQKGADPHKKNHVIGGGEISAVTFARYIVKNERLATFLEYY